MARIADFRSDWRMIVALALALQFTAAAPGAAQERPAVRSALDAIKQRDQELETLRAEQKKAAAKEKQLREEVDGLGEDRRKLTQAIIDAAQRIRSNEEAIAAAEARLRQSEETERGIQASLEGRRATIAEILAVLQRIGRHPPPALLIAPERALESVRAAMLVGAVLPELRGEAEALASELAELARVRKESVTQRDKLQAELATLSEERRRMTLLVEERRYRQGELEKALQSEREHAARLARQADNVKDLIAKLEQGLDSAAKAARAAARAAEEAKLQAGTRPDLAALRDPGRLGPAMEFAAAKGMLPLPVNGVKTRDFGAPDKLGGTEKGISITTRAGAQVTAPCDGWVVYAAPYRSYGQLLILNAGGGYHVLLAGMERISVDLGQFVLTGEPVAVMGSGAQTGSMMAARSPQPVLYIEFRKDGVPVDPTPWWANNEGEKVRG